MLQTVSKHSHSETAHIELRHPLTIINQESMMAYAIVINLDRENNPEEACDELWKFIKESMLNAGFFYIRNTFTINLPEREACELARQTIESIESHLEYYNSYLHRYLKDFYGFDIAATTNLLRPTTKKINLQDAVTDDV